MTKFLPHGRLCGLVLVYLTTTFFLSAQTPDLKTLLDHPVVKSATLSEERGRPSLIELQDLPVQKKGDNAVPDLLRELFQLKAGVDELRFERNTADSRNLRVAKYQRLYRGIPVEHDRYNVMSTAKGPQLIMAESYAIASTLNPTPTLDREQALARALAYVNAEVYAWEQITRDYVRHVWSAELFTAIDRELAAVQPGGSLTIVDDYDTPEVDPDLAWKFNIYAVDPMSRAWIYVNAHTGKVMLNNRIIKHASTPVTVETRYAGTREIMVDLQTNGTDPHSGLPLLDSRTNAPAAAPLYVLRDDTRGDGLETYDLNGAGGVPLSLAALYAQGKAFTDDDLDWSLAEHRRGGDINEAENDDVAWDAHWGTQVVYDYWLNVHGRNSYDDNGIAIKSFLHFGVAYDNAFWNGTAMTYGDGSYQGGANPDGTFAPLMSLDVCSHEVGHAICEFTSDLVYARESGAMNEGFSDIWGAAVEAYVARTIDPELAETMAPWGIGEQIDERDGGIQYPDDGWRALRYMDEPGLAGDPDTYGGANWVNPECGEPNLANDQCGVHTNSGVLNKWFFLLTEGESAVNDLGDNYSVNGLGFEISERIAYGTELLLTPNATFAEARAVSIAFARSMSDAGGGECGAFEQEVTNAWFGVGVGPAFNCTQVAGFTQKKSFVSERVADNTSCDASKIFMVTAAVNGNGEVTTGGSAIRGEDYQLLNPRFRTGAAGFGVHDFEIEIFDEGVIEGDETIVLLLPGGNSHVVTIIDDDIALAPSDTEVSLLNETMRATTLPPGWAVQTLTGSANSWYSSANSGAYVGAALVSGSGIPTYNSVGDNDIILSSAEIDARGLHALSLTFDWVAGGETDVPGGVSGLNVEAVPFDYGNLAYSFDGTTWTDFPDFSPFVGTLVSLNSGTFTGTLPDFLDGTHFYLGWRWRNDANAGSAYSFSFENVSLTGEFPSIASETMVAEEALGPRGDFYLLSPNGEEIIARITNNSDFDYGCTTVSVVTAGTGKNRCAGGVFLDKTFSISPENTTRNGDFEITWYLTDSEISGFTAATGFEADEVSVFQTRNFVCSGVRDTRETADYTLVETINGGIAMTSRFPSLRGFYAIGVEDGFLPVLMKGFTAERATVGNELRWETTSELNNEGFVVQRSDHPKAGFTDIAFVAAASKEGRGANYAYLDATAASERTWYYRLVQRDFDGVTTPSDIRKVDQGDHRVVVFPNPVRNALSVQLTAGANLELFNTAGQLLLRRFVTGSTDLDLGELIPGVYLLKTILEDGTSQTIRVVKQ